MCLLVLWLSRLLLCAGAGIVGPLVGVSVVGGGTCDACGVGGGDDGTGDGRPVGTLGDC